ncbi:fimbria/pilus outer membrane usher protein [Sphingomonas sp.]
MSKWAAAVAMLAAGLMFANAVLARAGASQTLFVELVVNGQVKSGFAELRIEEQRLRMAASTLRDAGIAIADDGDVDLRAAGFDPAYDALQQRLALTVPVSMLPVTHRSARPRERVTADAAMGGALNYDAFLQSSSGRTALSIWTEQRVFGAFGNASNTGVLRAAAGGGEGFPAGYLRYDTRLRHVDPERAIAFTAGDLITGGMAWTRPVRLGGLQIGRNFRSRPDLVTAPLPSFVGEAAVPGAVDLFVDGYRQQRESVAPGRFVLENMPVISGAGVATIVTTDAVGRQVATDIPFYVAPELLRPGLTDFSAEIGVVRKRYGLASFAYGQAAASFFVRHGLNRRWTVEAHGEASERSAAIGMGAVWMPGLFGTINASAVASRTGEASGTQLGIGYQYAGRRFSFAADHRRRSRDFRTLADFDLRDRAASGSASRAVASANLERWGSIGFGYLDVRPSGQPRARLATASWSLPLSRGVTAFASADYDLDRNSASGQIRIAMPLGGGTAGAGVVVDRSRGLVVQGDYTRAAAFAGGPGVAASAAVDDHGRAYGQFDATLRTRAVQLNAGGSVADRRGAVWAGASGSVVLIDHGVFLANDVSDAFALVSTGGVAGVPVHYENQLVGRTDRRGHVLIPRIPAYQPASIGIDPMALEAGQMPVTVRRRVAIAEGSAIVIAMPIRTLRSATLALVDATGAAIEAGSVATLADGRQSTIGWDGILYVEDVAQASMVRVARADGGHCTVRVGNLAVASSFEHREGVPCQ